MESDAVAVSELKRRPEIKNPHEVRLYDGLAFSYCSELIAVFFMARELMKSKNRTRIEMIFVGFCLPLEIRARMIFCNGALACLIGPP